MFVTCKNGRFHFRFMQHSWLMFEYQVSVWGNLSQLHEGASIDLWYQHVRLSCSVQYRTISGMIYTYRLSVIACKLIISVELYYTITELVACVCVCISTLSSNSFTPSTNLQSSVAILGLAYTQTCTATWWPTTCCWRVPMQPINVVCGQMFLTSRIYWPRGFCLFSAQYQILSAWIRRMIICKVE